MVDKERKNILRWILPMTIIVINLLLNIRYIFRVLVLDDLYYWGLYKSMSPSEFIFNTWANKFRPIYNLIQYVIYELVGKNYYILWWINIILNIIVALVIFYFAYKIADNLWIAWGGGLFFIRSQGLPIIKSHRYSVLWKPWDCYVQLAYYIYFTSIYGNRI